MSYHFAFWYYNSPSISSNPISVGCCVKKSSTRRTYFRKMSVLKMKTFCSIRLILHCNFKDAETGLMAHYHKWMKHKAKLLLGKCQSIAVDLCWRRYDVKMAEHLIFHFHSICCQAKEIKLSLPNGIFWKIPHSEETIPRMIFLGKSS